MMLLLPLIVTLTIDAQHFDANMCGLKELTEAQRQKGADLYGQWKLQKAKSKRAKNEDVAYIIPVVFHLIEKNAAITDDKIRQLVEELNQGFAHEGMFSSGPDGVDTQIRFCLTNTTPDGGVTTGITRTKSDYTNFDMDLENAKLKTIVQWDPRYYLNVWVVSEIYSEIIRSYKGRDWWTRIGAEGYSSLPGGVITEDDFLDGVVIAGSDPGLLIHECGHYLGLLHTFEGGCKNDNCLEDGDMVCDTPPDFSQFESCGVNSCSTDTLSNFSNNTFFEDVPDMGSNFMDYFNGSCQSDFSEGQAKRMHFHLEQYRVNLYLESDGNSQACESPCLQDFDVSFDQSIGLPTPADEVIFNSEAKNISNYQWHVEYLGENTANYSVAWKKNYVPSTAVVSIDTFLSYTFPEVGKYRVYLKAWGDDPDCFTSYSRIVRVICGVDARYWPDKRLIASKLPVSRFTEPVTFNNISTGASQYEWLVEHQSLNGEPDLPPFSSDNDELTYLFEEPGNYTISFIASNGSCVDRANSFQLQVVDPTIDAEPAIEKVSCYGEDSLRIELKIYNHGYDTVNVGTPISFYSENPMANVNAQLIGTYILPKVVYGFDSANYEVLLSKKLQLNEIYALFNNDGEGNLPVSFPPPDLNVYSFNTQYPSSGYVELTYDNNLTTQSFQVDIQNLINDLWACTGENVLLEIQGDSVSAASWRSLFQGELGTESTISYEVQRPDSIYLSVETIYGCNFSDSIAVSISSPSVGVADEEVKIRKGDSYQLNAFGAATYLWTPEDWLDDPNSASPITTPLESIHYTVEGRDSLGCVNTAQIMVYIITTAYIPSLFTPNDDGQNDFLRIYGLEEVNSLDFKIFNRSGSLIFETTDAAFVGTQGWNGSSKGKEQPNGIYFWKISGTYVNGNPLLLNGEKTGAIHLVR